mmetsp:Transcript_12460/g.39387  ORF Transcript_12460/g.39387 Transcript_12460/m.39387 type:complete len:210 (+) Transcript_12460:1420-2049(+)
MRSVTDVVSSRRDRYKVLGVRTTGTAGGTVGKRGEGGGGGTDARLARGPRQRPVTARPIASHAQHLHCESSYVWHPITRQSCHGARKGVSIREGGPAAVAEANDGGAQACLDGPVAKERGGKEGIDDTVVRLVRQRLSRCDDIVDERRRRQPQRREASDDFWVGVAEPGTLGVRGTASRRELTGVPLDRKATGCVVDCTFVRRDKSRVG